MSRATAPTTFFRSWDGAASAPALGARMGFAHAFRLGLALLLICYWNRVLSCPFLSIHFSEHDEAQEAATPWAFA